MKKTKLIIIGLAVVFLATSTVYAQMPGQKQKPADEYRGRMAKELNLTQEQEVKLEANRKAQRQEVNKLLTAIKEKQAKLGEELNKPGATRASIQTLAGEIKSLQAQLTDSRINGILAVKQILSPEQFDKFGQMTEKRQQNRKDRFSHWHEKMMSR
jgi:Spy/CpxP family protein refolding chaperone